MSADATLPPLLAQNPRLDPLPNPPPLAGEGRVGALPALAMRTGGLR
jgi:hypothetical protein